MPLKTLLTRVQPLKSFVSTQARITASEGPLGLEVVIEPRAPSRPVGSGCGRKRPGYDHPPGPRRFRFVPLWGIAVVSLSTRRRVDGPRWGVTVALIPWAEGKHPLTTTDPWALARWAKRWAWREVAEVFGTPWEDVFRSVPMAVGWGLGHRSLDGIEALGVDAVPWRKGHRYLTLVDQIDGHARRWLRVGRDRTAQSFLRSARMLGQGRSAAITFVWSGRWPPSLKGIARKAGQASHVLDRDPIMARMNQAIDEVRAAEANRLKRNGEEPVLKHARWCLLKRPEDRTDRQEVKLAGLRKCHLKAVRSYLPREGFPRSGEYRSPAWARRFLKRWCTRAMRSQIEPRKEVARPLRSHAALILTWFRAKGTMSSGVVEGRNAKVKLTMRESYGFRTAEAIELALSHSLGKLPEPESTHRFC